MAQKVKFAARFNYTWPSRAVTDFPEGWEGPVKDEVAEAAKAAGALDGEPSRTTKEPVTAEIDTSGDAIGQDAPEPAKK